jgi:hypothetical protein
VGPTLYINEKIQGFQQILDKSYKFSRDIILVYGDKCIQNFDEEHLDYQMRLEGRKLDFEDGRWAELPQDRIQLRAFVLAVSNLRGLPSDRQLHPTTKDQWLTDDKNCLLCYSPTIWDIL